MARQPNIGRVYGDSVEIASSTNACGIGLRCLGSKLASRASGETCFLSVKPVPSSLARTTGGSLHPRTRPKTRGRYCSLAYSALACFRMGMSGSAVPLSSSLLPTADTRWLLRRSQQDQDCTDASKHSRSDQQTLALVWKVNCHDRHDDGMSNIQPRGEDDHRAIH